MIRRHIEEAFRAALADTPVVLVNGARQTGKTTLVRAMAKGLEHARYLSLDDAGVLASASQDPVGFVADAKGTLIIDEVQKVPTLFAAIKASVDRDRQPGRFLLTGSANVLMLPHLSDSLAGRMEILTLRPLSQGEIAGQRETFVDRVFHGSPVAQGRTNERNPLLAERIHRGGYPEALVRAEARRRKWFASYLTAILQRDIRDLSNIEGLADTPRLLALLAARSAGLLNVAEVSRSSGIPHSTLQRYLALFEAAFLIHRMPAWTANLGKRLVKSPKLMLADTGFMAYLLNTSEAAVLEDAHYSGRFLETFVGCELLKQIEWSETGPALMHYRTSGGAEVDFVLEEGGRRVVGVEVKRSKTVTSSDFDGLKALAGDTKSRFTAGIVLYGGEEALPFGDRLWALPIHHLWTE